MPAERFHYSMRLCVRNISHLHLFQDELINVFLAPVKSRLVLQKNSLVRMCVPEGNATNKPLQPASNKGNWFYLNFVSVEMLKGKEEVLFHEQSFNPFE